MNSYPGSDYFLKIFGQWKQLFYRLAQYKKFAIEQKDQDPNQSKYKDGYPDHLHRSDSSKMEGLASQLRISGLYRLAAWSSEIIS